MSRTLPPRSRPQTLPAEGTGACPHLGCSENRCSAATSLSRLDEAFRCFTGGHTACPTFQRRNEEGTEPSPTALRADRDPGLLFAPLRIADVDLPGAAPACRVGGGSSAVLTLRGTPVSVTRRRRLVPALG